jgi:hypothetical protein
MTFTRPGCVITIGPQSGLSGVSYVNKGWGKLRSISLSGTVDGVTFTAAGPQCGKQGTLSDGKIKPKATLTATSSGGAPQGISME